MRRERGYVLVVTLFVVLVVTTAAMLVTATLRLHMDQLRQEARQVHAGALLDSALAQALSRLWSDPDFAGAGPEPLDGGTFEIETSRVDGLTVEVTVRGTWGGLRRAARAVVRVDRNKAKPPRVLRWEPAS